MYSSYSRPRSNQRPLLSIALPTNTPSKMSWTARGPCGRLNSCKTAVRPFWCSRIPAANCSATSSARRWRSGRFLRLAIGVAAALGKAHQRGLIHKDVKPGQYSGEHGEWRGAADRLRNSIATYARTAAARSSRGYRRDAGLHGARADGANESLDRFAQRSLFARRYILRNADREPSLYGFRSDGMDPLPYCPASRGAWRAGERNSRDAFVDRDEAAREDRRRALSDRRGRRGRSASLPVEWQSHGHIDPFPLGAQDASDRLLIAEGLYGREREIAALLASFDRVVAQGAARARAGVRLFRRRQVLGGERAA